MCAGLFSLRHYLFAPLSSRDWAVIEKIKQDESRPWLTQSRWSARIFACWFYISVGSYSAQVVGEKSSSLLCCFWTRQICKWQSDCCLNFVSMLTVNKISPRIFSRSLLVANLQRRFVFGTCAPLSVRFACFSDGVVNPTPLRKVQSSSKPKPPTKTISDDRLHHYVTFAIVITRLRLADTDDVIGNSIRTGRCSYVSHGSGKLRCVLWQDGISAASAQLRFVMNEGVGFGATRS